MSAISVSAFESFVEFSELVQGLFQGLRVLDFFTGVQCQIHLHVEVSTYAFTCSG
ncbi:MAG: hypothetical protein OYL97_07900 [Candidatus Poribacteria bacterium]|nr:hypothetical protein [Candidatus Poribacteria bacterium]